MDLEPLQPILSKFSPIRKEQQPSREIITDMIHVWWNRVDSASEIEVVRKEEPVQILVRSGKVQFEVKHASF